MKLNIYYVIIQNKKHDKIMKYSNYNNLISKIKNKKYMNRIN